MALFNLCIARATLHEQSHLTELQLKDLNSYQILPLLIRTMGFNRKLSEMTNYSANHRSATRHAKPLKGKFDVKDPNK